MKRSPTARATRAGLYLALPAVVALAAFFVLPLGQIVVQSFTDPVPGLNNYTSLVTDGVTLKVLGRTMLVGFIVTGGTLLLAYPYTYVMCHVKPSVRALMITVVLIPFWVSMLARNYAWYILMQRGGPIETVLKWVGIDGVVLIGTTTGVVIVMIGVLIPFMVLPMYSVMSQIDSRLIDAGQSLGANRRASFRQVYLPLSKPGIVQACSLVFILTLGFYITPALIGSSQGALIAQEMAIRTRELLDFGGAGAMGVVLLFVTAVVLLIGRGFSSRGSSGQVWQPSGYGTTSNGVMRPGAGTTAAAWAVAVLLVLPVLVIVPLSFSASTNFQFPPPAWSTRWYENLFASPAWTFALDNSLKVGALTALLATALGTLAALGMSKMPRRWSGLFSGLVMVPLIIPNILVALAVYSTFLNLKLNGTLTGLVLAHTAIALPFVVIAVRARLQGMDSRLTTAALSLGATPVAAFRQIVFPLLLPGVLSAIVLAFVTSFDEVVIALFLHTPKNTTLPVQMFNSVAIEIDPTISAAASLVVVVVSLAILIGQLALLRRRKGALS